MFRHFPLLKKVLLPIIPFFLFLSAWAEDYRVVSLPCGGATGIIPAVFLAHLERQTQLSITELVDEIWGTSAGAITAAMLASPDLHTGAPYRSAARVVQFFENNFATFFRARSTLSTLSDEIGAGFRIKDTHLTLRILTAAATSAQWRRPNLFKTYDLRDFSSDGQGTTPYNDATLSSVVSASSNVYPYLFFSPTQVAISPTETVSAIDPASFYAPGVGDPTGYFLAQALKKMSHADTLSIYFFGNAFIQKSHLKWIRDLLATTQKTYRIYSDQGTKTSGGSEPVQIKIFSVAVPVDVEQMMDQAWEDYFNSFTIQAFGKVIKTLVRGTQTLAQFTSSGLFHASRFVLGVPRTDSYSRTFGGMKKLAAANFLAAGAASSDRLKSKAQEVIENSDTLQLILNELREAAKLKLVRSPRNL